MHKYPANDDQSTIDKWNVRELVKLRVKNENLRMKEWKLTAPPIGPGD